MAATLVSGAVFGAALAFSNIFQPSTIISQFRLENWYMMEVFLTAIASSTLIVSALQNTTYTKLSPRCYNSIGIFSFCDGNIIGGAFLGIGMALSGSCPGTVLVQIGAGVRSAYFTMGGAVLGGIFWTGFLKPYFYHHICNKKGKRAPENLTIDKSLGLSKCFTTAAMESLIIIAVGSMMTFTHLEPEAKVSPIIGGLLIGLAQLFSLLVRKTPVGVSTAYEEVGNMFWWILSGLSESEKPVSFGATIFGSGIVGGAWALSTMFPQLFNVPITNITRSRGVAGGFLMILGARMAGGCTSGHGISGVSLLSISSMITIGSAITAGIVTGVAVL